MALVRSRSSSATAPDEQPTSKKINKSKKFPWIWNEPSTPLNFIESIKSPILNIRVGPEAKILQIHKNILTESADYFKKMFDGKFIEATTHAAEFPEDDEGAWEGLIEWCYTGHLPDSGTEVSGIEKAVSGVGIEAGPGFFATIKLICLAEKYCIADLHNGTIDNLSPYLVQEGADAPFFSWPAFQELYRYVYSHSGEGTPIRRYIAAYFTFLMACPKNVCKSTYDPADMVSLATEIPDVMSDYFTLALQHRDLEGGPPKPWDLDPCNYHIHTPGVAVCPRAYGGQSCFNYPSLEAEVHYRVQHDYQEDGSAFRSVSELGNYLGSTTAEVISAVRNLIEDGANVEWEEEGHLVALITPESFEASKKIEPKDVDVESE